MSNLAFAAASKNVAVTVLGLLTLLLGISYASLGGWMMMAGTGWFMEHDPDPGKQLGAWFGLGAALIIVIGIPFAMLGIVVVLAALGVLLRKSWGRMLTFAVAGMAILLGLLWISGVEDVLQDSTDIAIGACQILFGILALVILITKGAEFSRPRL